MPDMTVLVEHGAVIVDVRTKVEYQAGHIENSINVPLDIIKAEAERLKNLNKPIITVCRSGNRSEIARSILTAAGLEAYNGGAWTTLRNQIQL